MAKYHKSPKTHKWAVCVAKDCPYGDIPDEARATLRPVVLRNSRSDSPPVPITAVVDEDGEITLEHEDGYKVAPAGYAALWCYRCGAYFPEGYYEAVDHARTERLLAGDPFVSRESIPCPNEKCSSSYTHVEELHVDVLHSEAKYWNADEVRKAHWFHVTTRENWLSQAQDGTGFDEEEGIELGRVFVHVGSRESAMHRLRDLRVQHQREGITPTYYLYEVTVAPEAPVNPHVLEDVSDGWPEVIIDKPAPEAREVGASWQDRAQDLDWRIQQQYQPDGVSAYVNRYEAPGTVSLIANPTKLVQVAREEIRF